MNTDIRPDQVTIIANLSSSYAAVYIDGHLKEFGDLDEVTEWVLTRVGVTLDYDDGFLRSGAQGDIAPTLDAIQEWHDGARERERVAREAYEAAARIAAREAAEAAEAARVASEGAISTAAQKRALAKALLAEADALDKTD